MTALFGPDGSYGVFVRSDTNVEDLPGFTGAGLNLTVPHVVGFEKVWDAIRRVWASPFTERAYAWRQSRMATPEHVYVSVLLMKSIPAEKSGVMVTTDLARGLPGWITVAVNEGVGGAVDGQAAEQLRIHLPTGEIRLMAQATEPLKRVLLPEGGVAEIPVKNTETVLGGAEISRLIELARTLPARYPLLRDKEGRPAPADVEFGFLSGRLVLFQIRPFLESARARQSRFLNSLDREPEKKRVGIVELDQIPPGERK
jgi:phosphoenolpyruvate synthase/pyruvate phosphate dikinase